MVSPKQIRKIKNNTPSKSMNALQEDIKIDEDIGVKSRVPSPLKRGFTSMKLKFSRSNSLKILQHIQDYTKIDAVHAEIFYPHIAIIGRLIGLKKVIGLNGKSHIMNINEGGNGILSSEEEINAGYINDALCQNNIASLYAALQYGMIINHDYVAGKNINFDAKIYLDAFRVMHSCGNVEGVVKFLQDPYSKLKENGIKTKHNEEDISKIMSIISKQFYEFSGVMFLLSLETARSAGIKYVVDAARYYYVDCRTIFTSGIGYKSKSGLYNLLEDRASCNLEYIRKFLEPRMAGYLRSQEAYNNFEVRIQQGREFIESKQVV